MTTECLGCFLGGNFISEAGVSLSNSADLSPSRVISRGFGNESALKPGMETLMACPREPEVGPEIPAGPFHLESGSPRKHTRPFEAGLWLLNGDRVAF